MNLLDNAPSKPSKFEFKPFHLNLTKNWVEINDDSRGAYSTGSQIKFKT